MIRLLLDMGVAQSTAEHLRSQGHDAVHLTEEGLGRMPDEGIVAKAKNERRVIVTHDLDFGRIVALSGLPVPSIITLRLSDMRPERVNAVLDAVLRETERQLAAGALVSATDEAIRVRQLPFG